MYKLLEASFNYTFKNIDLLTQALTHRSKSKVNYERMEFLGDSLVNFFVAEHLMKNTDLPEGDLSVFRSNLVSTANLKNIVIKNEWHKHLNIGDSLKNTTTDISNIYADVFESIVCAIYLDGGFECAKQFVKVHLLSSINTDVNKDYKTLLQELVASKNANYKLSYLEVGQSGPSHEPVFEISLYLNDKLINTSSGKSKKIAQQNCAKMFYEQILKNGLNA